jgi:predicted Fe-Mo cluster-binding NifX family protein
LFGNVWRWYELRIAIATKDFKGLEDEVAEDLARSPTITIVEIDPKGKTYRLVEIFENEASKFNHGAGPVFVYILMKRNVNIVIGPEVGVGVKELLNKLGMSFFKSEPGTRVKRVIEDIIRML